MTIWELAQTVYGHAINNTLDNSTKKSANTAIHSSCSNHSLDLSIAKSSNVQLVRYGMRIIHDIISFFNKSSKQGFILKKTLIKDQIVL